MQTHTPWASHTRPFVSNAFSPHYLAVALAVGASVQLWLLLLREQQYLLHLFAGLQYL
jgi:hypothetical protein